MATRLVAARTRGGRELGQTGTHKRYATFVEDVRRAAEWTLEEMCQECGVQIGWLKKLRQGLNVKAKRRREFEASLIVAYGERCPGHHLDIPAWDEDSIAPNIESSPGDDRGTPHEIAVSTASDFLDEALAVFEVRQPRNEDELRVTWELDAESYGTACWPFEILRDRWVAFPHGIQCVFFGNEYLGSFGCWPLTSKFAAALQHGEVDEGDITPAMLARAHTSKTRAWYFSGIEMKPERRRSPALRHLLSYGLKDVWTATDVGYPCAMLACAFSMEGKSLLTRFGFSCVAADVDWPIYRLSITSPAHFSSVLRRRGL